MMVGSTLNNEANQQQGRITRKHEN